MIQPPPLTRCFVALCFGAAAVLAVLEWRDPFPQPAAMPELASSSDLEDAQTETAVADTNQTVQWMEPDGWFSQTTGLNTARSQRTEASLTASVQLVLSLETRSLEVRTFGQPTATYEVAIGQDDWQTPTGQFTVTNKLEDPAWLHPITKEEIPPGPENPLGTRWIGFWTDGKAEIGFHGTNQEELIGEAVSHGCVRMRNQDIEDLYEQIGIGTLVKVM